MSHGLLSTASSDLGPKIRVYQARESGEVLSRLAFQSCLLNLDSRLQCTVLYNIEGRIRITA